MENAEQIEYIYIYKYLKLHIKYLTLASSAGDAETEFWGFFTSSSAEHSEHI